MADVFNRNTKQHLKSVNTPDYPESEWIINPTFIPDCESKYIIVEGNTIREMTTEEKAVVDYVAPQPVPTAEELAATAKVTQRQDVETEIRKVYSLTDELGFAREGLAELLPNNVNIQMWNSVVRAAKSKYPKV